MAESKPCEPLVRSMDTHQEELNAQTMNSIKSRLEMIAKQQGMHFHFNESTCYLTAEYFYLEVLLLPSGEVQEVKVALHGEYPSSSRSLLHLLRSNNFSDFSMRVGELFVQYNFPRDNETAKSKMLKSLQSLWKDLQEISDVPNEPVSIERQLGWSNGRAGLMPQKPARPTLCFYISPNYCPPNSDQSFEKFWEFKPIAIGISDLTRKLRITSLISKPPQPDIQGPHHSYSQITNEKFVVYFLLKLKTPLPVLSHVVEKIGQITGLTAPDCDLQWAPLPKLLMYNSANADLLEGLETYTTVFLEGAVHSYVHPDSSWNIPTQRAALLSTVPFTQLDHIAPMQELLHHQYAFNNLLNSSLTRSLIPASICDLYFEVRPESTTGISVTFSHPCSDSLAVLMINVVNSHEITCHLFGEGFSDSSSGVLDEYMSELLTRCLSIPVAMRALYKKLEETTSCPPAAVAENDPMMDTDGQSPAASQCAAMPDVPDVCGAVSVLKAELPPEMSASVPEDPHPFDPEAPMANDQN